MSGGTMSDNVQYNNEGEAMGLIYLTDAEFSELVLLIDDDPVDEDLLAGIRMKLVAKRKRLRSKTRRNLQDHTSK